MNRKKKINQILKKKAKKANAKLHPKSNKPRYVSKAERAAQQSGTDVADEGLASESTVIAE